MLLRCRSRDTLLIWYLLGRLASKEATLLGGILIEQIRQSITTYAMHITGVYMEQTVGSAIANN